MRIPDPVAPSCLLTFDVEEHFQIEAARPYITSDSWGRHASRLEASMDWLLGLLEDRGTKATFFTLGYVARRHPAIVRGIVDGGHELACHGDLHDRLHRLTPQAFADDLRRAKGALEDVGGRSVRGYRAPTFSLTRKTAWAVDVLAKEGFAYDSSVQPIRHPQYGEPLSPRWAYRLRGPAGGGVLEIPPLSYELGAWRLPVAGGGYFRLFPLSLMRRGIEQAARAGHPAMLYFHPWEFDPDQPRLPLGRVAQMRTYVGIHRTRTRLAKLIDAYPVSAVDRWLERQDTSRWPSYALEAAPGAQAA